MCVISGPKKKEGVGGLVTSCFLFSLEAYTIDLFQQVRESDLVREVQYLSMAGRCAGL